MAKGVFLPSPKLNSALIVTCLQALIDANPTIEFNSVYFDDKQEGYKIFFTEPDDSEVLRKMSCLTSVGIEDPIWIFPLVSNLIIRDLVIQYPRFEFENELKNTIGERFGARVLGVTKPSSPSFKEDWRVTIDIPEFKGVRVFHQENFSNVFKLRLRKYNEDFEVTFRCTKCDCSGHFSHECGSDVVVSNKSRSDTENINNSQPIVEEPESPPRKIAHTTVYCPPGQQQVNGISDSSNNKSPTNNNSMEVVAADLGRELIRRSGVLRTSTTPIDYYEPSDLESDPDDDIAAEHGVLDVSSQVMSAEEKRARQEEISRKLKVKQENLMDFELVIPKQEPQSPIKMPDDESANSIDFEDFEYNSNQSSPARPSSIGSSITGGSKGTTFNSEDASRSPNNTQSSLHSDAEITINPSPGPSTEGGGRKPYSRAPPVIRVEVTTVLSERLQDCINDACNTAQILDRTTLDNFFTHVKKKSNPLRVALNFTKNTKGLKGQLQRILHMYYNTPQTGTKEDMSFIKWLNGLVERFDGTIPRKRKKNDFIYDKNFVP